MTREERKQAKLEKKKLNKEYKQAKREAKIMAIREKGLEQIKSEYNKICKKSIISKILWIASLIGGWAFLTPSIILGGVTWLSAVSCVFFLGGLAVNVHVTKYDKARCLFETAIEQETNEILTDAEKVFYKTYELIAENIGLVRLAYEINREKSNSKSDELEPFGPLQYAKFDFNKNTWVEEENATETEQDGEQTSENEQGEKYLHNVDFWFNEDDDESKTIKDNKQVERQAGQTDEEDNKEGKKPLLSNTDIWFDD